MAEPASIPDDGYVFAAKRRKGISEDPNPDSFWIDMPFLIQIAKAKEENPNWGAKKILDELHVAYIERSVKKNFSLYFYDAESKCLYRKSQDLNVNRRKCLSTESLFEFIKDNHKKDHHKSEAIYDSLRTSVFPVVRENIKILFKLHVSCESCNNAVEIPKTTVQRRPIPPTYPNSCWQTDLMKMQPVRGFGYICNIVDCYSRFAFGGPLKGKHAKDVAGLLLKFIYLLGSPHILQSDNGKEFDLSQVVEDFKTKQIHGRPYHPHSQGRVERFNRTLTEYFRRELYVACKGLALKTARILLQ
jgi:transposase InsO family protein